jgi:hypothetical protein
MFKECWASEKIHGTSCHISWKNKELHFFAGGCNYLLFIKLFDQEALKLQFTALGFAEDVTIYGEGCGGKMQGMSHTYGPNLRFVAFEVKLGDRWLDVPSAEMIVKKMGLDFVPYEKCSTDIEVLNALRDRPSEYAVRCGITEPRPREGVVLRPLIELTKNNGGRIIVKHKGETFGETKHPRDINVEDLQVLRDAEAIADEWVTEQRLDHILGKLPSFGIENIGEIIKAMVEDVEREAVDEIVKSKEARKAISTKTSKMFKARLMKGLTNE